MSTPKKKFKLRDLDIDRVDIVSRGANQHAHIVIAKGMDGHPEDCACEDCKRSRVKNRMKGGRPAEVPVEMVNKHYPGEQDHRQLNHGVWATGRGGSRDARSKPENQIKGQGELDLGARRGGRGGGSDQLEVRNLAQDTGWKGHPTDTAAEMRAAGRGDEMLPKDQKTPDPTPSGPRSISDIAREIRRDWGGKVNYAAKPYLDAMSSLDKISDNYYADSAESVVAYFLSNATSWRGETAKRVKAELREMLKMKKSLEPPRVPVNSVSRLYAGDPFFKNAMMGYPPPGMTQPQMPQQPPQPPQMPQGQPGMPPPAMPQAPGTVPGMPPLATDRAGLAQFMAARLAAMPQQPGMPPGMYGAPPAAPMSPMGNMPQAPQPQMPLAPGIPQPGSIPPQMPQPVPGSQPPAPAGAGAPQPGAQAPGSPTGDKPPSPGGESGEKPGEKPGGLGMPKTSGDLSRQLDSMKPKQSPDSPEEPEEDEDSERPPFAQQEDKKKRNPFG